MTHPSGGDADARGRPSLLVVGESLVDVVHGADGTRTERAGGSPANVAVGLARLGHPTMLLTAFGQDRLGGLIRSHLVESGVDVAHDDLATSSAVATIDDSGAATYEFNVQWELTERRLPPSVELFHVGSVSAVLEPGATAVRRMAAAARHRATVTYDVNARPALMGRPDRARAAVEAMGALADVVKASDEDLAWLYPDRSIEESATAWLSPPVDCRAAVVTRGASGATVFGPGLRVDATAPAVDVVDTIGAGDSFMAGLLSALAERGLVGGQRRVALTDLGREAWSEVLEYAVRCAAVTVGRPGADPPSDADLGDSR